MICRGLLWPIGLVYSFVAWCLSFRSFGCCYYSLESDGFGDLLARVHLPPAKLSSAHLSTRDRPSSPFKMTPRLLLFF